jgi:hypothetical protein
MSEPTTHPRPGGHSLEESVEDILAAAKPLPFGDEMIIDDLTDDEERIFLDAINNA